MTPSPFRCAIALLISLIMCAPAMARFDELADLHADLSALRPSVQDLAPSEAYAQQSALTGSLAEIARERANEVDPLYLNLLIGDGEAGLAALDAWRAARAQTPAEPGRIPGLVYELYLRTLAAPPRSSGADPQTALETILADQLDGMSDLSVYQAGDFTGYSLEMGDAFIAQLLDQAVAADDAEAVDWPWLIAQYARHMVNHALLERATALYEAEIARRFEIERDVQIITEDGVTLSAMVVRDRDRQTRQPAALLYTIYSDETRNLREAIHAAAHGYAGVAADARGKRLSRDEIRPYETEARDVNAVIGWIAEQPWNDGQVAMYGGSYNGFVQWAALKDPHPALRTIVPYVAALSGLGLPMENNIFLNANYGWAFYVASNRGLDEATYFDPERWWSLQLDWFESGRPYREIDQIDGQSNPWLQRWLDHPAYDAYWQAMVPHGAEFAAIDIPILSITGYYDDGQISALHYFNEHLRHQPDADHVLLIGPYDHRSAQGRPRGALRGVDLDPVAEIDVPELTFAWLDHVLRGAPRPALLADRVNHQIMGTNRWFSAPSLEALNLATQRLHLTAANEAGPHRLTVEPNDAASPVRLEIDFADRQVWRNAHYYPDPILTDGPADWTGAVFISAPLTERMALSGQFSGALSVRINKRDVDIGVTLYELRPDGSHIHLSHYLGRASHAGDLTRRRLLTPGGVATVPIERTRMVSRLLEEGSRLVAVLDVNMNPFAQINYGTGGDVSEESIEDAGPPLTLEWLPGSYLDIPLHPAPAD